MLYHDHGDYVHYNGITNVIPVNTYYHDQCYDISYEYQLVINDNVTIIIIMGITNYDHVHYNGIISPDNTIISIPLY